MSAVENDEYQEYVDHASRSLVTHPWPIDRQPSPDEWLEWFLSLDAPTQYEVAAAVLDATETATRCAQRHPPGSVP